MRTRSGICTDIGEILTDNKSLKDTVSKLDKKFARHLFRGEEIENTKRDSWGCFRAESSEYAAWFNGPVVDLEVRQRELISHFPIWPGGRRFAVTLSHDVDAVSNPADTQTADAYFWNFEKYCLLEEKYNFTSAFYLVARKLPDRINPDYDIQQQPLRSTLEYLAKSGWEIGLHHSFGSHLDGNIIATEKDLLEQVVGNVVLGGRCHFLPFEVGVTPFAMKQAGLLYDSTLGFNEIVGFRSGTCYPHCFMNAQGKLDGVLELPMHIMDGTLFWDMGKSPEEALQVMQTMTETVENLNGCLNVLWHQRVLDNPDYPGWGEVYRDYLSWLAEKDVWVTSPGNVAKFWSGIDNDFSKYWQQFQKELCAELQER